VRPWIATTVALLLACAAPAAAMDAPAATPSPSAKPTPKPRPSGPLTLAEAEALVRDVSAKVEAIRGMKFRTPVTVKIISGAEAREEFKSNLTPEAEADARHTQDAYVQLGLVPAGTDLVRGYLDLAQSGLAGYYKHGSGTFYLLDHVSAEDARGVMAHELTHALEDQHYDLAAVARKAGDNPDHSIAITAVVEGSAMAVMLAYLGREEGEEKATEELHRTESRRAARLKVAPSFTQRSLLLPYLLGFSFLLQGKPWEFYLGGGVQARDIDEAYRYPPYSTRQILHPEQYWIGRARYKEQKLTLPDLSATMGPGWKKATEGSIGELGLAVLTGSRQSIEVPWALMPSRWTNDAAVGAVGDVYQHYVSGERKVTVLLTRWESEIDANQFAKALVSKNHYFIRFGVNFLVIAGDIGDRAEPVGIAALQGSKYWQ
jgi:hypothetical protein